MSRKQLTFIATVVIPILVAAGGAIGAIIGYWPKGEDPGVAAERVSACMEQHNLDRAKVVTITPTDEEYREEAEAPIETRRFQRCEWPPSTGADPDGYTEFTASLVVAVPYASEAEAIGWADRITAPCERIRLYYTYASQGQQDRQPPLVVDVGEMVIRVTGEPWPEDQQLPFYFGRSEAVVLRNSKVLLDDVQCEEIR